jgi:hypothetical protein
MCTALKVGTGNDVTFNKVGIGLGATGPVTQLDIGGNQMCIREPFTPSPGATSPAGTVCWDESGRLYVQTGSSGWKYVELGPISGASSFIGSTGATGLTMGATGQQFEYIPFLATSEELQIHVEIIGATGGGEVAGGYVGLGTAYTPFEYTIIENTADATLPAGSTTDFVEFPGQDIGERVIISLKVSDMYLMNYGPTDTLTPGFTLSGAYAFATNLDCSINFIVAQRT